MRPFLCRICHFQRWSCTPSEFRGDAMRVHAATSQEDGSEICGMKRPKSLRPLRAAISIILKMAEGLHALQLLSMFCDRLYFLQTQRKFLMEHRDAHP